MAKIGRNGRFPPFSLRLSFDERAQLEQAAGNMTLGAYIRERLFTGDEGLEGSKEVLLDDRQALAKLLGLLGQSQLAKNIHELAKAAESGSLLITPDTERMIRESYAEIMWMRKLLVIALGHEKSRRRRSKS